MYVSETRTLLHTQPKLGLLVTMNQLSFIFRWVETYCVGGNSNKCVTLVTVQYDLYLIF